MGCRTESPSHKDMEREDDFLRKVGKGSRGSWAITDSSGSLRGTNVLSEGKWSRAERGRWYKCELKDERNQCL